MHDDSNEADRGAGDLEDLGVDLAEAIIDRLEERGDVLRLKGKSYRRRHSGES